MRKTTVLLLALLAAVLTAGAQQPAAGRQPSVYAELFGASTLAGISYDARLKPGSPWGYRVGLGYAYARSSGIFAGSTSLKGASVPMEANYLLGRRRSKLELGLGLNLGYYSERYDTWTVKPAGEVGGVPYYEMEYAGEQRHSTWGYYLFGNIGYRYQPSRGFQFRVGVTPSFHLGGRHAVSKKWAPYVSFGYVF